MNRRNVWTTLALLAGWTGRLESQVPARVAFDSAAYAWEAGRYPEALERLERLLAGPARDTLLPRIAVLTGELYRTRELAPDAAEPRWSADGTRLAYEIGGDSARQSVVLDLQKTAGGRRDTLPGYGVTFAPDGSGIAFLSADSRSVVLRAAPGGAERTVQTPGLVGLALVYAADSGPPLLVATPDPESQPPALYDLGTGAPRPLTGGGNLATLPVRAAGNHVVYTSAEAGVTVRAPDGTARTYPGVSPAVSADGSSLTFLSRQGSDWTIMRARIGAEPTVMARSNRPTAVPAISPDGSTVVYQSMPREDWELYVTTGAGVPRRLTHEIQHDISPQFVSQGRVLAVMGEGRHRRSYLYDAETGERTRFFHNNTVRTIAPEYEWAVRPDGNAVAIVSERDGDTVSPERGLYLVDLTDTVSVDEVLERVRTSLQAERDLRERGRAMFAPVASRVRPLVEAISSSRIYDYARSLYRFDSKHVTQPGNRLAIDYLVATLRSFGYEPELQWFEPAPGVRSANVVVTLRGTSNPEVQYVVGSHFDSVKEGPGSDDNTSGTTALLEVARVLARRPQAATIRLVWFTSEESGLRGSKEFVRVAREAGDRVVGALNNDMLGWANDDRLDNTIRYANAGLRDLQHAAAFLFTRLITYDAHYYKFTDAHSLVDGFGDVVSGIGSYPVLGNPHYHQPHDVLETVNHRLVAEVSRTTLASVVLMASSPSRLTEVAASRAASGAVEVTWKPAVERGVTAYRIRWEDGEGRIGGTRVVKGPSAKLTGVPKGATVAVRAVGPRGVEGWDWARVTLTEEAAPAS